MQINPKEAITHVTTGLKADLVTMLTGPPGVGKSAIIYGIAKKAHMEVIDIRLSQCDVVDLNGFPSIKDGVATYVPMDIFPVQGVFRVHAKGLQKDNDGNKGTWEGQTPIPKGKRGFLIFLDEFNSASLAVQAASYKLILDRRVGQHDLHPKARIVCAGNLAMDNAIVNRMSTAMQSRLLHLELTPDIGEWTEWAQKSNIDHRVISYVHYRPENLFKFDPNHDDKTFACPRTWEFVSRLLKHITTPLRESLPLIIGTIGQGIGQEFVTHTEIFSKLPSIDEILRNPIGALINEEPAMLFAVSHMVAAYINKTNIGILMEYVNRLPLEFETITLQHAIRKDPAIIDEQSVKDWITVKGEELF